MIKKIAVIGAGAWGTTLSILLTENKHAVTLWCYEKELANTINEFHENKLYLPGFQLPASIKASYNIEDVLDAEYFFIVIPSHFLRHTIKELKKKIKPNAKIVCATKGLEDKTYKTMPEVIAEELGTKNLALLSGPNLSKEIAAGLPAAAVVASKNPDFAKEVQNIVMSARFRIYVNTDVLGVALGGSLKNIIAIVAGICDGLELGNNAKAGILIRGIAEISRLGVSLGAEAQTFFGLSGMGDLITTCASSLSRNHEVGVQIAKGKKLAEILGQMRQVAEGVETTRAALHLAEKQKVEMPITEQIYKVLFEGKDPFSAISDLVTRKAKEE
ncbi:MAG: NAD(P)-dependent glycerol-3-phosphate dehydrogenase [Candidatus Saganbacteria bacterium]|nr:NAD(P)-dependent glycerol-3-phosphate dehydrogenase [Candidatus Saganbacteria bacterium]